MTYMTYAERAELVRAFMISPSMESFTPQLHHAGADCLASTWERDKKFFDHEYLIELERLRAWMLQQMASAWERIDQLTAAYRNGNHNVFKDNVGWFASLPRATRVYCWNRAVHQGPVELELAKACHHAWARLLLEFFQDNF